MESANRLYERRRFPRHRLGSQATVLCNRQVHRHCGPARISDLNQGGAQLGGFETPGLGSRHRILLHLPWYHPLTVEACIVRAIRPPQGPLQFGVQFVDLDGPLKSDLDQAIDIGLGYADPPSGPATLVAGAWDLLTPLSRELKRLGQRPILVTTPLDALVWLSRQSQNVVQVTLDGRWSPEHLMPLLDVLDQDHPALERVLVLADDVPVPDAIRPRVQRTMPSPHRGTAA